MKMSTKEKVYTCLIESNLPLSGEIIAKKLNVSRTAIWKAINSLKSEGHLIQGKPSEGYFILQESQEFNKEAILRYLNEANRSKVMVYDTLESTNATAKKLAEEGGDEWTVVLSKSQTKGRGRFERDFYSPKGGCYCSFILRPTTSVQDTLRVTMLVAVAICKTVNELCNKQLDIKWVNDLFYHDKKVCGILTEASLNLETGSLNYLVIGFGINLKLNEIPNELTDVIADIDYQGDKNLFVASIINKFQESLNLPMEDIVQFYREHNLLKDKTVLVRGGETGKAKVLDITTSGNLLVLFEDDRKRELTSGEVTLCKTKDE